MVRYFGTDGIRGQVGSWPITPEAFLQLGWATGAIYKREHPLASVIIGKDTRLSSDLLATAFMSGLSAAGVTVHSVGIVPTPALAYLTTNMKAQAGIMITASHNPFYDNGIKIFSQDGRKLTKALENAIEQQILQPFTLSNASSLGRILFTENIKHHYFSLCRKIIPSNFELSGKKIVLDCANGATYQIAPLLFTELGAELITLGTQPDGCNINQACGSTYPEKLKQIVIEEKADLGIAFDGDGDRLIMVDHTGELCDGDDLLFILARQLAQNKKFANKEGVVGTIMSNTGLEKALHQLGLPFIRTQVGDRHVHEALEKNQWNLGGEPSGHIIQKNILPSSDGIITALQILIALEGSSLYQARTSLQKFPQRLINIPSSNPDNIYQSIKIQAALKKAENELIAIQGRLLLRPSGTEPVIRLMLEGKDESLINTLAHELAIIITDACE